ncbi:MAG: DUF3299 domain-containing protein [Rhodothermia bacterium]|nr:DUF3299 domain-containing protein [Rhodothermia bacterium]
MRKLFIFLAAFFVLPLVSNAQQALSWDTLAKVESKWQNNKYVTVFKPEVKALNGKRIKIQGFMIPLEMGEKHKHFIIAARPAHCYFEAPGGKEMIEIFTPAAADYEFTPITVTGTIEVLENDKFGMYYRIKNAKVGG